MQTHDIIDETFKVVKNLGSGFTSVVVLGEHIESGVQLAIKIFKPHKSQKLMLEAFRKEVNSMKDFKHTNLINICAANENGVLVKKNGDKDNIMYLAVELAENAELFDFIADYGQGFSEKMARTLFVQLVKGLNAMHKAGMAHRDLKTENLFLDGGFNLKIGDFGFSKFMDPNVDSGKLKTQLGTSGYQSPELLEGQKYDGAANDIFALGVILFILVNAYPPFKEAKKTDNWYRHVYYEKYENFWITHSKKTKLSSELKELITGMLKNKNRWTIDEIANCDWVKGDLSSEDEYLADFAKRKQAVDLRKYNELQEKMQNEGISSVEITYKSGSEDKLKSLYKELENNTDSFLIRKWEGESKFIIRYEGQDLVSSYKSLLSKILKKDAEITLSKDSYDLDAEVAIIADTDDQGEADEDNEPQITKVSFSAGLYLDEKNDTTVAVFTKDPTSDIFDFKALVKGFSN